MSDDATLLDLKHEIVLFFGSSAEMAERRRSIIDRCRQFQVEKEAEACLFVMEKSELSDEEFAFIKEKYRVPRRVQMRLKAKVSG